MSAPFVAIWRGAPSALVDDEPALRVAAYAIWADAVAGKHGTPVSAESDVDVDVWQYEPLIVRVTGWAEP